jgi:hypothetical protein
MSVQAMSWLLDHSEARLAARLTLISIANHCDSKGENSYPSVGLIAREAKISTREVQRALHILVEIGELQVEFGAGPRGVHLYSIPAVRGDKLSPPGVTFRTEGVTNPTLEVTNPTKRGDKSDDAIRKNRQEPSEEPLVEPSVQRTSSDLSFRGALGRAPSSNLEPFPQTAFADEHSAVSDDHKNSNPTEAQIGQLYSRYPRKCGKLDAKKAIRKAVGVVMDGDPDHPAMPLADALDYLAQRVTLYAGCVQGFQPNYIPYPASWFNKGCFWDDERDWSQSEMKTNRNAHAPVSLPDDYVSPSEQIRRERAAAVAR